MTIVEGPRCGLFWAFKGSENLNLRSRFLLGPPSCFPMKWKLTAAISRVLQLVGRSRLGFWMPLGSLFKNTSKLEKCQKSREIAIFGRPSLRFSIKIETSGGHNSIALVPLFHCVGAFGPLLWCLSIKAFSVKKVTRDPQKIYI